VRQAAAVLGDAYAVEIVELHHNLPLLPLLAGLLERWKVEGLHRPGAPAGRRFPRQPDGSSGAAAPFGTAPAAVWGA